MTTEGSTSRYTIKEEFIWEGECGSKIHVVDFDCLTNDTHCSCQLFEFRGILCRHSLLVLGQEDVSKVPPKYVLRRWSKNVRRRHTLIKTSYNNNNEDPKMQRYQALCKRFYDIAEVACDSETASQKLLSDLNSIGTNLGVSTSMLSLVNDDGSHMTAHPYCSQDVGPRTEIDSVVVHSPVAVKRKADQGQRDCNLLSRKLQKKKIPEELKANIEGPIM
ncbi:hypothetical protein V8G54_010700 [Vigna mungo]|uniref:Protein FAR1-RELATED SEQUENCE n=1 Tax=Vigna mungo TaxID=3915 RepID=A0AAQ3S613_VIGMU